MNGSGSMVPHFLALTLLLVTSNCLAQEQRSHVGRATCIACHREEHSLWTGSHHDLAMLELDDDACRAPFDGTEVSAGGVLSRFLLVDDSPVIEVEDADGNIHRVDRLFVLNPSSNQVFSYYWDLDDVVVEAPTINHSRGVQDIACDGNRQLWIAGQEAGTTDATLTAYNFDGTPTGIDLTFPGQTILLTENSAAIPVARKFDADDPDGDQYSSLEELIAGANPYDDASTPATAIPDYVDPVENFSAEVVDGLDADGLDIELSWTWDSPAADFPDFYEITRTSARRRSVPRNETSDSRNASKVFCRTVKACLGRSPSSHRTSSHLGTCTPALGLRVEAAGRTVPSQRSATSTR